MKIFEIGVFVAMSIGMQFVAAKSLSGLEDQAFAVIGAPLNLHRQARSIDTSITRMHVTSVVRSRFAKVTTVSEMANTHDEAKELTFSVRLPEAAFISDFTMLVDDVTFVGKVKEKALAQEEYEAAKGKGNPTGLVTADVRQTQTFNVAANVPAHSTVSFTLVYQELLKRRLGKYNHEIFVNPGQLVDDFVVNVYITERAGITMLAAKHPVSGMGERGKVASGYDVNGEVPVDTDISRSRYQAKVTFKPTPAQQRRLLMIPEDDRKFSVIYDVTREVLGGEIRTRNGYFVHYFAPENLPVLPKKVVFVIDQSGSMYGRKLEQTKTAFETVLKDMSDADKFNIITFSSGVTVWRPKEMVSVTTRSVNDAIAYVRTIEATGSTNLNAGVLAAARLLKHVKADDKVSSAVILLTDGEPTVGVTDEAQIRTNVKQAVGGRFSVFCLGFGEYLNHDFLKRLAAENDGIARKIFEDSDAALQLEDFFQEVASPLLLNVKISYSGANVADVSKTNVDKYFGGSEVIVVGAKVEVDQPINSMISGVSRDGEVSYSVVSKEVDDDFEHWHDDAGDFEDFIERIWSYFTIKSLLEDKVLAETDAEVKTIVDRVMRLALKYGFVTPLTSMVVVLPEDEKTTTLPPFSTIHPPIPPCVLRGQAVTGDGIHPAIWCPYVVDEQDIRNQNQGQSKSAISMPRAGLPRAANSMSQGQRSVFSSSRVASSSLQYAFMPMPPAAAMMPMLDYNDAEESYWNPTPEVADNCGGTLNTPTGRIVSPGALGHDEAVYCDWTVELPEGSWIDFYVETLNTSANAVKVTSKDNEVLLDHSRGTKPSRYIPVAHNQIKVRMTIQPTEAAGGIVFSYKQFLPNSGAPTITDGDDSDSPAPSNCGHGISSSESASGFIASPNYPSAYPSEANCVWTFANDHPERLRLQITIDDMDIETNELGECVHDKLVVTNGDQAWVLCGYGAGDSILAEDSAVTTVSFSSDDKLESAGFKAAYRFVPKISSESR